MRLERRLVDLDAEAEAGRGVEEAVAQLALDRGDRRGEKALGGEAVGALAGGGPGQGAKLAGESGAELAEVTKWSNKYNLRLRWT